MRKSSDGGGKGGSERVRVQAVLCAGSAALIKLAEDNEPVCRFAWPSSVIHAFPERDKDGKRKEKTRYGARSRSLP